MYTSATQWRAKPVAAAALARGVAEPQRADFSRARAGPSLCRPAACCRAPIGAPQPQLILFLLLSDMLELHACSIAAKPCEPRLHERLLPSADISLKRVDGLFEPLDNNDVSTVKDLARLRAQYLAAVTIQRAALPVFDIYRYRSRSGIKSCNPKNQIW